MPSRVTVIFFLLISFTSFSQYLKREKQFIAKVERAKTDQEKIWALGNLSEYYYTFRLDAKGDSVTQKQLTLAELSHDKDLILQTLFGKSVSNINNWSSIETFEKAEAFIDQGLNYANELKRNDYAALAYIRKANLLRKRGKYEKAIQHATIAFSSIGDAPLDSVKTVLYLELGDIYKEMKTAVPAYNCYNNALELAYNLKNIPLQSDVYHHLAELYQSLGYKDLAKNNLFSSLALNLKYNNKEGILNDYIDLARFTDEKEFFDKALLLSDTLKLDRQILNSKKIMLAYIMVIEKDSKKALDYLQNNSDLKQFYINQGIANYYFNVGHIYKYSGNPDSAMYYYNLAEPELSKSFDVTIKRSVYKEMGECYLLMNDVPNAINYFEKALSVAKTIGEFSNLSLITSTLGKLYAKTGDYKKAYEYNQHYLLYQDSLKTLTNDRNLVLMEVKKAEEKKAKLDKELALQQQRIKNVQYISITIALALIFIIMMLVGMFPLSKFTIKILSFFAFICLFEFFVVFIDTEIVHTLTHGEPLKVWMMKIVIIALLVPLQHFMEHKMVHLLESRRLIEARKRLSFKKWFAAKKPAPVTETETGFVKKVELKEEEEDFEKDTALL